MSHFATGAGNAKCYGSSIDCGDNVYPTVGIGLSYLVKEEASVLIRLEVAKGKNDNEALYLRFGVPF